MTVDELLDWLGSHACLVELERCYRLLDGDYRRRWGRAPGWLQLADWMIGRLLEEVRALHLVVRQNSIRDLPRPLPSR